MAFGKRSGGPSGPPQPPSASAPPSSALPGSRRIAPNLIELGKGETDPAGGTDRIVRFLLDAYGDKHGVNAETVLSAAGALAGFAAQEAIWEGLVRPGKIASAQALVRVETKSGETYFFGDLLNTIVTSTQEGHLSIWSLAAGAAVKLGAQSLPRLEPIFAHCSETVGTPAFGVPVLPSNLALKELPRQALRHWPHIKSILLSAGVQPLHWPLEIGRAAQFLILQVNNALPADIGALVVMQAAIPMSKVDPRMVPGGTMVD
jgi:hypothetical protein